VLAVIASVQAHLLFQHFSQCITELSFTRRSEVVVEKHGVQPANLSSLLQGTCCSKKRYR